MIIDVDSNHVSLSIHFSFFLNETWIFTWSREFHNNPVSFVFGWANVNVVASRLSIEMSKKEEDEQHDETEQF
jgi:hypothetical protein